MDVSVIIPCYNSAAYLPRLASCLDEFHDGRTEIIFVNDGSSDESYEILRRLLPQVLALRQRNADLGAARNRAASCAQGKFLQLLDIIIVDNGSTDGRSGVPFNGQVAVPDSGRWLGGETAERLASWKRRMMQSRKAITL